MARIKESFNTNRMCLGESLPLKTPLSVIIDISERCNFKCNYCFRSGQKDDSWGFAIKNELMSMDVFKKIIYYEILFENDGALDKIDNFDSFFLACLNTVKDGDKK